MWSPRAQCDKKLYRQRMKEILEQELTEAAPGRVRYADPTNVAAVMAALPDLMSGREQSIFQQRRDALVEQLTTAFGLGGRARQVGSDPDERLRKAVEQKQWYAASELTKVGRPYEALDLLEAFAREEAAAHLDRLPGSPGHGCSEMLWLLERLDLEQLSPGWANWLSTHPTPAARLQVLQAECDKKP